MNLKLIFVFGLVCLVAVGSARPASDEYPEYEEEPAAPPPKKAPARTSPLAGRRAPLAGRNAKPSSTTTLSPPETEEEEEPVEGEDAEEVQASSTTEAPKKFIKSGSVRPFRSNDDLLATLKRRREQAASNKVSKVVHAEAEESAPAGEKEPAPKTPRPSSSSGRRNRFSGKATSEAVAPAEEGSSAAPPTRTGRRFSARN